MKTAAVRTFDRFLFVAVALAIFVCAASWDHASSEAPIDGAVVLETAQGCSSKVNVPAIDAAVVSGACSWLEGITPGGTLVTICAVAEELLQIADFVRTLLGAASSPDAGACTAIPTTNVCATKAQMGQAILEVLAKRRARLALDGGPLP